MYPSKSHDSNILARRISLRILLGDVKDTAGGAMSSFNCLQKAEGLVCSLLLVWGQMSTQQGVRHFLYGIQLQRRVSARAKADYNTNASLYTKGL